MLFNIILSLKVFAFFFLQISQSSFALPFSIMALFRPDKIDLITDSFFNSLHTFMFPKSVIFNNIGHSMKLKIIGNNDNSKWLTIPYGSKIEFDGTRNFFTKMLDKEYRVRIVLEISRGSTQPSSVDWLEFSAMYNNYFAPFKFLINNQGAYQLGENGLKGMWKIASWNADNDVPNTNPALIKWNGNWAFSCDFPGNDFSKIENMRGELCGAKCANTNGCTHFTHNPDERGGTCFMKNRVYISKAFAQYFPKQYVTCGIV
ncbi:uncharacterized protein LOC100199632 [Hydra vulgaris]|uniref:Uncharacterized protein LOC100199632 n=1 Tax=Hydra vulgaris TaxID=6087 RepID=A0ABM4CGW1_HYDVU